MNNDRNKSAIDIASENAIENDEQWQQQEDFLEEALEETFPGSDPISPGHPQSRTKGSAIA